MEQYKDYAVDIRTTATAGGYSARLALRRGGPRRHRAAIYFPPLGPQPTAASAADHALRWAQAFIDENATPAHPVQP